MLEAWVELENLSDGYLDICFNFKFQWKPWLGNLGALTRDLLDHGAPSAFLVKQDITVKNILFTRADSTHDTWELVLHGPCDLRKRVILSDTTA